MYVTVNRKAIESALLAEDPFINRSNWVTAVCRYGTLAICDCWDDAQDAIMNYIDVHGDEGDWLVRPATDDEVTDTLLVREIEDIEYRVSRDINYPEEFQGAFKRELVEFGYPEDGFIAFDTTPWDYGEGNVRFEVSPRF